jgi:hypothetical protein
VIKKKTLLCLFALLFTAYSAFAEKGLRFDLGVDGVLFILQSIEGALKNDGGSEGEGGEGNDIVEEEDMYLLPVVPLIGADLYYQTSGEKYRLGFGAKIYSLISASIVIPSIYAEMNLERFSAIAQFGAAPIVIAGFIPFIALPVADISASAWFKVTKRFKIGGSAMLIAVFPYEFYAPVYALSFRWTLAGA